MHSPVFQVRCMTGAHRSARAQLREAEIELKDQRERVAVLRRALPENPVTGSYTFTEATPGRTRGEIVLADLLSSTDRPLVIYHFMFNPDEPVACPVCTMWTDGFNGVSEHLAQRLDFAVVAKAQPEKLAAWAERRGWRKLRLLSSYHSTFNRDFGMETEDGSQWPGVSVFMEKAGVGVVHTYTGSAILDSDHFRGLDHLNPVWHVFDLTPIGRGDFMPKTAYGEVAQES